MGAAPSSPLASLVIDLDTLEEGAQELAVELPQAWVAHALSETDAVVPAGGAARLEFTLQADRTLLVRGHIDLRYEVPCARCLEPATVDVGAESDELCVTYVPADRLRSWADFPGAKTDGAEDKEIEPLDSAELDEIGYHGSKVDLRALISEQIVLAYPMRALCARGEACLGLCMRCGFNLNESGDSAPEACPSCGARLDGADALGPSAEDSTPDSPWKRALAKVVDPQD